jgi:hypothetical protein
MPTEQKGTQGFDLDQATTPHGRGGDRALANQLIKLGLA